MDKYYTLFNNLKLGILIITGKGIIEEANGTALNLLDISKDEIIGKSIEDEMWNVIDEDFNEVTSADFPAAVAANSLKEVSNKAFGVFIPSINKYIWLDVMASPVKFDDADEEKVILTFSDISRIVEKDNEIKLSNERFQTTIEILPIPLVVFKALRDKNNIIYDFEFIYVNEETVKANDISREETIGHTMLELHPGHRQSGVFEGFVNTVESGDPFLKKEVFYEGKFKNSLYTGYFEIRGHKFEDGIIAVWQDITEKKEYEKYLEYHSKVVENLFEGVILLNKNDEVLAYNKAAEEILGYTYEEIKNSSVRDFMDLLNFNSSKQEMKEKVSNEGFYKTEMEITAKNGTVKDVELTTFALRGDEEEVIGYGNLIRDISLQKAYEENLERSERQFRSLAENSLDVISRLDKKLNYIYVNPQIEKITGTLPSERIGKNMGDFDMEIEQREELIKKFRTVFKTKEPLFDEFDFINGDKKFYFSTVITPEFDSEMKEVVSLLVVSRDITELRNNQEAVYEAYNYVESIINTVKDPLLVLGSNLELISANTNFYKTFGTNEKKAAGENISLLFSGTKDFDSVLDKLRQVAEGESIEEIELRMNTESAGFRIMSLRAQPLIQESKKNPLILVSLNDITDLKMAEGKSLRLIKELERSNKELEQFAYVASHDLQEPLRMVHSYTALLKERYQDKLDSDANDFIEFASEGAERMQELIHDLLDYSKVKESDEELSKVDMNEVVEEVLENLKYLIETEKPNVIYGKLPFVYGRKENIVRLFQNLIVNSIKYRSEKPLKIAIAYEKEGHFTKFSVADNGIGIAKKSYERIFKIFQRLHNRTKYSGTGIGLAICKKIVENHGGRIWLDSKLGKGTTFYFTLPGKSQAVLLGLIDERTEEFSNIIN